MKTATKAAKAKRAAESEVLNARPEMLRRVLLGLVTALVVARPLLPGEDPGRTLPTTGTAGLFVTFLWLLAAVGWAGWRVWTRQTDWRGSAVECGLLTVAGVVFLSAAFAAGYKHPAWLIAWEWLAIVAAFCLVRQLFRSDQENRCLLAALLATGVSMAAYGIYQPFQPERPLAAGIDPTGALLAIYGIDWSDVPGRDPSVGNSVAAHFAESGSLAMFLVLVAPALAIGWYRIGQAPRRSNPRLLLIGLAFAAVFLCLGMTKSWPAILALALTGFGFLWISQGQDAGLTVSRTLGIAVVAIVGIVLLVSEGGFLKSRLEYAGSTFRMNGDFFWLGVGPGNFSRHYPAYLSTATAERVFEPHSFVLEMLGTCGVLGLAAVVATLFVFYRAVWPELRQPWPAIPPEESDRTEQPAAVTGSSQTTNWEFYLGGVGGLTLAFLVHLTQPQGDILRLGLLAIARSFIWFGVFALLESIPWTGRSMLTATCAGVTAALICLSMSGGFFNPALAQPLWIMAALTLNALPEQRVMEARGAFFTLPTPALAVVSLIYLLVILLPVTSAARSVRMARQAYPFWQAKFEDDRRKEEMPTASVARQLSTANTMASLLQERILKPLESAQKADPTDAGAHVELAYWHGKAWELYARIPNAAKAKQLEYGSQASKNFEAAQKLDPSGKPGYWVAYQLHLNVARQPGLSQRSQTQQYLNAVNHLERLVKLDPGDARLRYLISEAYYVTNDEETEKRGQQQAAYALEIDKLAKPGQRRFTPEEREKLEQWAKPPKEGGK
jgi:hypothetical protein